MISHQFRCRQGSTAGRACLLATVRVGAGGGLVADVRRRIEAMDVTGPFWTTDKTTVVLDDLAPPYLLLSCEHNQGVALPVETVRALVRDTPTGASFVG